MTREEAINHIKILKPMINPPTDKQVGWLETWIYKEDIEALDMAIQALEQESRKGHWYIDERPESDREVICSNCEQPVFKYHKLDFDYRPKYCPNCGTEMRGVEE